MPVGNPMQLTVQQRDEGLESRRIPGAPLRQQRRYGLGIVRDHIHLSDGGCELFGSPQET
jgi:hypothetical protein